MMNWDQIETRWALMTRRIRADFGDTQGDATGSRVQTATRREALGASIARSQIAAQAEPERKTPAK